MIEFYSGKYVVIGPPGTGKTTFLSRQVREVVDRYSGSVRSQIYPTPVLICSLTRAAAAEVAGRDLPIKRSCVSTLHGHCYRALERPAVLGAEHVEEWNNTRPWKISPSNFSDDSFGERPVESTPATDGDRMLAELELARHRLDDALPMHLEHFADEWVAFKREHDIIDFTDMIELAIEQTTCAPGNPAVIMVDEAQDLSALEYRLIKQWSEAAEATIVVGDPWQALYTWRGADPSLFFDPSIPESHRRVLSKSYRVPAHVLQVAVSWVAAHLSDFRAIEYKPRDPVDGESDPRGEVAISTSTIYSPDEVVDEAEHAAKSGRTFMIQATCSYMLANILAHLRRLHIPFSNPWRKHRRDWNPIGHSPTSTCARLLSFIAPCHDNPDRRGWTIADAVSFMHPMRVKGQLTRGAKKQLERMSRESGVLVYGAEDDDDDDDAFIGERMTPEQERAEPVRAEDVEDWFEHPFRDAISSVMNGALSCAEAARLWQDSLLTVPKQSAEYPVGLVAAIGPKAIQEPPRVFVGTIHSFKGAEADTTAVFPDLSMAGFRQWTAGEGSARDEVVRTFYVAMTRARRRLIVCANATSSCAPLRRSVREIMEGWC